MEHRSSAEIIRGAASAVSPLVVDLHRADSRPLPVALQSTGNHIPDARPVPFLRYYDRDFARLEAEKLWGKTWQFACREEDIPEVGDRMPYDVGTQSYLIVRTGAGEFRAFHNSCRHRGLRLCSGQGEGESIRCPFHAWEWNLDGSLRRIPSQWDFPQVDASEYGLAEVKVGTWGGFIFINPDPDAPPFEPTLGILPAHFASWKPEEHFTAVHARKLVKANWKLTMEAFLEAYHVIETHTDSMPFTGDASTQYDIWDDGVSHVSRLITPLGVPSPHLGDEASRYDAAAGTAALFAMAAGPGVEPPPVTGENGRREIAEWRRAAMGMALGRDFSALCDAELVDTIQYFSFPNFCPWYGEGLPLVYQFLPLGDDPGTSIMDVRILVPVPGGGAPRPPSAPVVHLGFDDAFSSVEGLGLLSHIFDQDMSNIPIQQLGVQAAGPNASFATLGRYQESRIQHFHRVLEATLGLDE